MAGDWLMASGFHELETGKTGRGGVRDKHARGRSPGFPLSKTQQKMGLERKYVQYA
jgi:hypothetical protein